MERARSAGTAERAEVGRRLREYLEAQPAVLFAYLFGSFARGEDFRDIDVGLYVDERAVPADAALKFALAVSLELDRVAGHPTDVSVLNGAPVALRHAATGGELLLERAPETRERFVTDTWREYGDFEPFMRAFLRDILES